MLLPRAALAASFFFACSLPVVAQVYPSQGETPVTDDAELIPAEVEARIVERLTALRAEAGARFEVVTLPSAGLYAMGEDSDVYARALAENFGLTGTDEGRWALMLVFAEDRELRIEPGPAYGDDAAAIQSVIDGDILPAFRAGEFAQGIESGVNGLIDTVIAPTPEPAAPAEEPAPVATAESSAPAEGGGALWWVLGAIAAVGAGIAALVKRSNAKLAATPCPSCGKTGLTRERVTLQEATPKTEGRGETRTTCPSCGHVTAQPFTISKTSPPQSQAKPAQAAAKTGTKSQGGGASGNW